MLFWSALASKILIISLRVLIISSAFLVTRFSCYFLSHRYTSKKFPSKNEQSIVITSGYNYLKLNNGMPRSGVFILYQLARLKERPLLCLHLAKWPRGVITCQSAVIRRLDMKAIVTGTALSMLSEINWLLRLVSVGKGAWTISLYNQACFLAEQKTKGFKTINKILILSAYT